MAPLTAGARPAMLVAEKPTGQVCPKGQEVSTHLPSLPDASEWVGGKAEVVSSSVSLWHSNLELSAGEEAGGRDAHSHLCLHLSQS